MTEVERGGGGTDYYAVILYSPTSFKVPISSGHRLSLLTS